MSHGILATGFIIFLVALALVGMLAQVNVLNHEFWTRIPRWAMILGVVAAAAIFVIPIFVTFRY